MSIKTAAFRIGRRLGKRPITSRIFCLAERLLPLDRIARSEHAVAFYHPRPSWDPHILVVPTVPFPSIGTDTVTLAQQIALIWELVDLAEIVAQKMDMGNEISMLINGGSRQDIGQVHGHVITITPNDNTVATYMLSDPELSQESWAQLLNAWSAAATVPENGYSLVIEIRSGDTKIAWLTQSIHHPV